MQFQITINSTVPRIHLKVVLEFETFCTVEMPKQFLPRPHPHYFYANLDELWEPCFQKWEGKYPVALLVAGLPGRQRVRSLSTLLLTVPSADDRRPSVPRHRLKNLRPHSRNFLGRSWEDFLS